MDHTEKIAADGHFILIVTSGSQQPVHRQSCPIGSRVLLFSSLSFFFKSLLLSLVPNAQATDILGGIMNWPLPQMLPVTKNDLSLKGRWGFSDSTL